VAIQSLCTGDCVDGVVEKYSNMVYRLALAQMKTKHDAEDVFQDEFMRYISKSRVFESEEHRKHWLIRVTINRCRSLWAAWFRKTEPLNEQIPFETEEQGDLFDYLMMLPQKYRLVIHLFYGEELSVKEISKLINARESTVRTWLTRARAILREKLKGGFDDE
jgi:RNA polymerase sigma-70 factor (ECF subfamily)